MNNTSNNLEKTILIVSVSVIIFIAAFFITTNTSTTPLSRNQIPPTVNPKEATLFIAGDIMLSREVRGKILQANDVNLPFLRIADAVKKAEVAFANLESPFNNQESPSDNRLIFKAEPNSVHGLVNAGFDILSTANNHAFDQGRDAVAYTSNWLQENGITPVGTGVDCHDGKIMEANGIVFGFLAYSYAAFNDGGAIPDSMVCDWNDKEQMVTDIRTIKTKVDVLIVSSHFGEEYQRKPSEEDAEIARFAIDAGADLLIGHHPHWVQTIEEYNGKYIFYSLGNFVFDQMWSQDTKEGLTANISFKDKAVDRIELKPVVIENYCCPRWSNELETKNILTKINPNYSTNILLENGKIADSWAAATSQNYQVRTP